MSYEADLRDGIVRRLGTNIPGAGHDLDVAWEDQDPMPAWPILPRVDPTPDQLIAVYLGSPVYERADVITPVTIRVRGARNGATDDVLDVCQAIHDDFYPRGFPLVHKTFGAVKIGAVFPGGRASLGRDTEQRENVSLNFAFRGRRA